MLMKIVYIANRNIIAKRRQRMRKTHWRHVRLVIIVTPAHLSSEEENR